MALPPPPPVPWPAPARRAVPALGWALLAGAAFLLLVQFLAFLESFDALNRWEPDTSRAQTWGAGAALAGFAGCVAAGWAAYRARVPLATTAFPVLAGALGAALLATTFGATLGPLGILSWLIVEAGVAGLTLAVLVAAAVVAWIGRGAGVAWGLACGGLLFHGTVYLLVTVTMLLRLESLARQATRANEPPDVAAAGLLASLAALAVATSMSRRRRPKP